MRIDEQCFDIVPWHSKHFCLLLKTIWHKLGYFFSGLFALTNCVEHFLKRVVINLSFKFGTAKLKIIVVYDY